MSLDPRVNREADPKRVCTRCGLPITGGRNTYTLAPHVWPYVGPMHWPTQRCGATR